MRVFYDRDAELSEICSRRVAVIGYGAQGHAHALNLRDSGVEVVVALHHGSASAERARAAGFTVASVSEAAQTRDVLVMCAPDEVLPDLYASEIAPYLRAGQTLMFAHGFAVHFGFIQAPPGIDVVMVAPKGPGTALRSSFERGGGLPAIVAVAQDASGRAEKLAYAYGAAIGCGRAGMIASTFKIETEGDLYGEQVVLCGGLAQLIRTAWEVQVETGTPPELAYFDCLHEVKLLSDLIHERGIAGMNTAISNTAEYGEYITGPRIIDAHVKDAMRAVMADVQSGKFAQQWMAEYRAGAPKLQKMREAAAAHPIEAAGRSVRALLANKGAKVGRPPLPQLFAQFRLECEWIRSCYNTYSYLWEDPDRDETLMERSVPSFFNDLNRILIEYLFLRVCLITDPATSRVSGVTRDNLTCHLLNEELRKVNKFSSDIERLSGDLTRLRDFIVPARNRLLAHLDVKQLFSGQDDLGKHPEHEATLFFQTLSRYCDAVGEAVGEGPLDFDNAGRGSGDVIDLMTLIDLGIRAKDKRTP